jgi:hypothetical protein
MRADTISRVRTAALSVVTTSALAVALTAVPATQAATVSGSAWQTTASGFSRPHSHAPRVVTLVTGDRVLVRQDSSGRTLASLLPSSPHYGKPVEFVHTATHTWVVPRLAPALRGRLDTSLFDVAALARSGRVRLRVTFAKGVAPRALPGLGVRTRATHGLSGGRTTALASYDARRPLPASLASSLRGVVRISAAHAAQAPAPDYELHTLTIDATTVKGKPLPGSDVFLVNADDARLYDAMGGILHGQWKASVPSGHYFVMVSDFRHIVVRQVSVGDADTETGLSMADATTKPRLESPPGLRSLDPELLIQASDESGHGSFGFGFGGILPKLSPVRHVVAGSLFTEVSNLWTPKGYEPVTFHHGQMQDHPIKRMAAAKVVRRGVPDSLQVAYHPRQYADVTIRHYATGPKQSSYDSWVGFSPIDTGVFVQAFPSVRPGVIHARLRAGRDLTWNSSTAVSDSFRSVTELDQTAKYRRGQHAVVRFFRGPVAPVADRGGESKRVGYSCQLCVIKGSLGGYLAMFASAGTDQFGLTDHGRFTVYRGRRVLSSGDTFLTPFVKSVTPGERLRLVATTTPPDRKYVLSSQVSDVWHFQVPAARRAIVPILRAAYSPPVSTANVGPAGRVSYPVTFDNLGPVDARVSHAAVRWSVDGRHWHAADLKRIDKNTFRASYRNPRATRAHPYLSLRVSARDRAGRSVSESVEHAYVLPRGTARAAHASTPKRHGRFRPARLCHAPGKHAYSCFVRLGQRTRSAHRAAPDPAGWGAPALRDAYDIGEPAGPTGTIAVIGAFDYPHAEADMNHYRAQYGLPACTSTSGCFTRLNQKGEAGHYPQRDSDWGVEAALDLQMVSAACPTCHIVLVEANRPSDGALFKAEQTAVDAGATVTTHSFGRIELTGAEGDAQHFDHPGVTAVASTGDAGYGPAQFPASSPDVVAVGGTVLSRSATDPRGWSEKAWADGSSGCSAYFAKVAGQTDTGCHGRTTADVSAVARGLAIYDTSLPKRYRGWLTVDGTSASAPLVAGMIASVDGGGLRPSGLYAASAGFSDVVGGSNGFCRGSYLCTGVVGYDAPTGLGSPSSPYAFRPPV